MRFCFFLIFVFFPVIAEASAVIGKDEVFVITPIVFLATGTPEAAVFNYFFTLGIFSGMVALFIRLILRTFKL